MEAEIERDAAALDRLTKQIDGYHVTAVIYAAIKTGVVDGLASGLHGVQVLARDLNVSAPHLARLMRAAAAIGLCIEEPSGWYSLSATGHALRRESSSSLRERVMMAVEQYWSPWANLAHSVETGQTAFEHLHGMSPWQWRNDNAAAGALFNAWLGKETHNVGQVLADGLDLTAARTVADIGGGDASLLAALLDRHPALVGILFEQPGVVEDVCRQRRDPLVAGRLRTVPGDFFAEIPVSADVFLLKSVLHDWDDDRSRQILENCRRAMSPDSRLFVIERALPESSVDDLAVVLLDIHMMAITGGRERTLSELAEMVGHAGFTLPAAIDSIAGFAVIEARPR